MPFMEAALSQARQAAAAGEVPIGCVIVRAGVIIARGHNRTLLDRDPTAHAEVVAIRAACSAIGSERLIGCDLFVTLEPCPMCAGAIALARVRRLYYGAADPKSGAVESRLRLYRAGCCQHRPEVYGGIGEQQAARLLTEFFRGKRHSARAGG